MKNWTRFVFVVLAAALVAYEAKNSAGQRLIDEPVLNSVIVMMVITSILGPVLTEVYGKRLLKVQPSPTAEPELAVAADIPA